MKRLRAVLGCWLLSFSIAGVASAEEEIRYLLSFIAESDCTFVRNGDEYNAEQAAQHLRKKYERGRAYVSSAEQFIARIASASSWTGMPYRVRCSNETAASGDWLRAALGAYRARDLAD